MRKLGVRANADLPEQAELAYAFGARGIGLCRTEHMFFGEDRLPIMQRVILARTEADRRAALDELLPLQRDDFVGVFTAMRGEPVTIRLVDPPLHEFLPKREELMVEIAQLEVARGGKSRLKRQRELLRRVEELHEFNPMMGHRGVRLAISYPEITEMQVRAIIEAACSLKRQWLTVVPEIMIPLVGHVKELLHQRAVIDRVADEVMSAAGVAVRYLVGTMIELPRAAIVAAELAEHSDFFSFGTNDLTQMTFGFSSGRLNEVSSRLSRPANPGPRPLCLDRCAGYRTAGGNGRDRGTPDATITQARSVRRARGRPRLDPVLREGRTRLRQRLPVSHPDGPTCRRPRRTETKRRRG